MGAVRAWAPHTRWTSDEEAIVRAHYPTTELSELALMLPGRDRRKIQCKANMMGLVRYQPPKRTAEQTREAKRKHMAEKRAKDIEAARAYSNVYRLKHRDRLNAKTREETARRLFWARALRLRNGVTAKMLAALWKQQRGRCALSGVRLDRSAEIDHKIPRARGGKDEISNLQWVTYAANRAKRDLTDAEFLELCRNCVRWIGERIEQVEAIAEAA